MKKQVDERLSQSIRIGFLDSKFSLDETPQLLFRKMNLSFSAQMKLHSFIQLLFQSNLPMKQTWRNRQMPGYHGTVAAGRLEPGTVAAAFVSGDFIGFQPVFHWDSLFLDA